MTRERDVERYLVARVKAAGGEVRKVQWIGRAGAPDRLVMLPGNSVFVEVKRPGQAATPAQLREHGRMRAAGLVVWVVSDQASADAVLMR